MPHCNGLYIVCGHLCKLALNVKITSKFCQPVSLLFDILAPRPEILQLPAKKEMLR